MSQPNKELIRSLYEARELGDLESVRSMLTEDVAWSEPNLDNPHTGDLRGTDAVLGMIWEAQRITNGTFRLTPRNILTHGEQVVAFIDWSAERGGKWIEGKEVAVYRVRDNKIVEAFFHVDNPVSDEAFWE